MKKIFISLLVIIVCASGFYGEAAGSSYLASQSEKNELIFAKTDDNNTIRFSGNQTQITSTSNKSDPLIGSWQSIFVGDHGSGGGFPEKTYDYQLTKETYPGSGVWNLSGGEAHIYITADRPSNENIEKKGAYLEATATATTIDFNKGTISWSTVDINDVNNPFGTKSALSDFSQYATGIFTYTFATSETLQKWIMDTSSKGSQSVKFATQLSSPPTTAAPEPGTWALILLGLGLLSLGLRNKLRGDAFAHRNGHVGILPAL
ncbi:MAG: PEP-CTERM sorting domain-containing protein [Deltaproteobacteria bacterium]|nr:PEP-CTERM sorting domain-containing protein [Deltaproteobacteria bacterium]